MNRSAIFYVIGVVTLLALFATMPKPKPAASRFGPLVEVQP